MTADRFQQVRSLFERALDHAPGQRGTWLAGACAGDEELRREVERYLSLDERTHGTPVLDTGAAPQLVLATAERLLGQQVGSFRLLRVLGSGGMGTVFEAEQDRPRRRVALKMMRYGFGGDRARRRFEYEAEILARLQHPGIAQIHEVGTFAVGGVEQPYFAMELIEGARPLDCHARECGLDALAIVGLVAEVCEAVHHGHQRGVVHRDLKPGNVLVGAAGRPKVIDFGIARGTSVELQATLLTEAGSLVGTLAYMSPEQLDTGGDAIDIRADVYALGVILFQLLTDTLPVDLRDLPLGAAADRIRRCEPPKPSSLRPGAFPADLDWIVRKAMAKDPNERYGSAGDLRADLHRLLRREAVSAGPPSSTYRLRRFVQRNAFAVGAVATVLVALVAGTVATTIGWQRALAAEREANLQKQESIEAANGLWRVTMLQAEVLGGAEGNPNVKLLDVVERARARFEHRRLTDPFVAAAIHNALGSSYSSLGQHEAARRQFELAVELTSDRAGQARLIHYSAQANLAKLETEAGRLDAAETRLRDAVAGLARTYGERHLETLKARGNLASVLLERARYEAARDEFAAVLPALAAVAGPGHKATVNAHTGHAMAVQNLGDVDAAEAELREAVAIGADQLGLQDDQTLRAQNALAALLIDRKRHAEAAPLLQEVLVAREQVSGRTHPSTLRVLNNLAICHEKQEQFAEAEAIYQRILAVRPVASKELFDLVTRFNLGVALYSQTAVEKLAEARTVLAALVADAAAVLPPENWRLAVFRQHYGICLRKAGDQAAAERELLASYAALDAALGAAHERTQRGAAELAALYAAWGRAEDAANWRARGGG